MRDHQTDALLERLRAYHMGRDEGDRYLEIEQRSQRLSDKEWSALKAGTPGHEAVEQDVFSRLRIFSRRSLSALSETELQDLYFLGEVIQADRRFRLLDEVQRLAIGNGCSTLKSAMAGEKGDFLPSVRVRAIIEASKAGNSELATEIRSWSSKQATMEQFAIMNNTKN